MTSDEIVRQIDRLDHPDPTRQDQVLERFSEQPDRARPVVLSNLSVVNARVRRGLLRWLNDHLTADATLPLMRYVFDERDSLAEDTGRAMAMAMLLKRARQTDEPGERGRLRAFGEDIVDDRHPDVRRLAVRILAFVGDRRSRSAVERLADDSDQSVRQEAERTANTLRDAPHPAGADGESIDPGELRRQLANSAGARRRQLLAQWRRHKKRTDIAVDILERGAELQSEALRVLLDEPAAAARPFLADIVLCGPEHDNAPLALRLLAKLADGGPVDSSETKAVRRALDSSDVLTRAAGCRAAASLNLSRFARRVVDLTEAREMSLALDAARSLAGLVDSSSDKLLSNIHTALKTHYRRRRNHPGDRDHLELIAYLQKALGEIASPETIRIKQIHHTVLSLIDEAGEHRPIRVTGLQLLERTTPAEGFDRFDQWTSESSQILLDLVDESEPAARRRIGSVLERTAPEGWEGFDRAVQKLSALGCGDEGRTVVALLARSGSEWAAERLEEIADSDDRGAANAARRVLRDRRRDRDVIDVEFIPRNRGEDGIP